VNDPPEKTGAMIGIVGGVGPYAGLDLALKICDQTRATRDQDHLPVAMLSLPGQIADRTEFLLGHAPRNPATVIASVILDLEKLGASVVGIPCNTAHSERILGPIEDELDRAGSKVVLVNMIRRTVEHVSKQMPDIERVGMLCTSGTLQTRVYDKALESGGLVAIRPEPNVQEQLIHRAIYDKQYGIKATGRPVSDEATGMLTEAISHLAGQGAEAFILGCTELPLAFAHSDVPAGPLIDPTLVLARALIAAVDPSKLAPPNAG